VYSRSCTGFTAPIAFTSATRRKASGPRFWPEGLEPERNRVEQNSYPGRGTEGRLWVGRDQHHNGAPEDALPLS